MRVRSLTSALLLAVGFALGPVHPGHAGVSAAEVGCASQVKDPWTGVLVCVVSGSQSGPGGSTVQVTGGGVPGCFHDGQRIECTVSPSAGIPGGSLYNWSGGFECWVDSAGGTTDPDRIAELLDRDWPVTGAQTTTAALYICGYPPLHSSGGPSSYGLVWSQSAPSPPIAIDPAQLAVAAVNQMGLTAIEQQIAPPPLSENPDSMGLVGLPVWLWTEPTDVTWGPQTASVSAVGVTVSATMEVVKVEWDLGDGTVLTCGPGTPYVASYGLQRSPTCGHTYSRIGTPYTITASSTWEGSWSGGGESGELSLTLTTTEQLAIGEAQAIRTN